MESKALVKSTNINVTCRFFARTPSRILRMVNICEVVDLFLRKPFWFFLSMLSILGSIRFRSRAIVDFGCYGCKCYASVVFWLIRGPPFFREGEYASLHPSIYRILIVYCVAVSGAVMSSKLSWSSILPGEFRPALQLSYF